jgi:hypothetical protein
MILTKAEIAEVLAPYKKWVRKKEFEFERMLDRWDKESTTDEQRKRDWAQYLYHYLMDHKGLLKRIEKEVGRRFDEKRQAS